MPGPQHTVLGAFPIVPRGTVASVNASGLKPALIKVQVEGSVPVPAAQVNLRGSMVWNGAPRLGCPGVSKSKLDCSSMSSCSVIRIGNPLWNVVMPDIAQPFRILPLNPSYCGTGNCQ